MTLDRLWTWIAIALPALAALMVPLPAVDLAYQVRAGNEILATGAIPSVDTWTFTVAGAPWVDQQWLAQVWLAVGHAFGGWELLALLRALLVSLSVGAWMAAARARGASPRVTAILALAAFALSAPALALRPQLFGIALFALLLWQVGVRDRYPRVYLTAPVLVLAWANIHGSFVLGPAIIGYAWLSDVVAGQPWRRSLAVFVVGTAATFGNPYVAGAWTYAAGIGANPVISGQISEWARTSPFDMPGILFYPSVLGAAFLAWRGRRSMRWPDWILLVVAALMGTWAVRGVAWWAPVAVFILARVLAARPTHLPVGPGKGGAPVLPDRARRAGRINWATSLLLLWLLVVSLPWWRPPDPLTGRVGLLSYAPPGLAAALAALAEPGDRVVVPQAWTSWFEWAVPQASYFVDTRFELFPDWVWADEASIRRGGHEAAEALERWKVQFVVVASDEPTPAGAWMPVWGGPEGVILTRATSR